MGKEQNENLETIMYEGQSNFIDFVTMTSILGYDYVIKCTPLKEGLQDELGAACQSQTELIDTLLLVSDMGYSSRVAKLEIVD